MGGARPDGHQAAGFRAHLEPHPMMLEICDVLAQDTVPSMSPALDVLEAMRGYQARFRASTNAAELRRYDPASHASDAGRTSEAHL